MKRFFDTPLPPNSVPKLQAFFLRMLTFAFLLAFRQWHESCLIALPLGYDMKARPFSGALIPAIFLQVLLVQGFPV